MTSKVIVNITPAQFPINKKLNDVVHVERPSGSLGLGALGLTPTDPVVRVNQLEQNIKFLQEQHGVMLAGLHQEVEILRQRNRDLQLQLVFSKGNISVLSSATSSPSDEETQIRANTSPNQVNVTPLQIEILERDIAELRTNLSESRTRNVYLQNIVDDQKKRIAVLENEKLDISVGGKKVGKENKETKVKVVPEAQGEMHEKLEDAERLVRRLRRENEEQRKEIVSLRTNANLSGNRPRDTGYGGNGYTNTYRNTYYRNSQNQTTQSRFPPLHPQGFWHSPDYQGSRKAGPAHNRIDRENSAEVVGRPAPTLPHLRDRNMASTSQGYSNPAYNNYQGGNQKRGHNFFRKQEEGGSRRGKGTRGYHSQKHSYQEEK